MNRCILVLALLATLAAAPAARSQSTSTGQQPEKRSLRLLLEGDSSIAPYAFQELYKRGAEHGCEISFASGVADSYDARVVLTADDGMVLCRGEKTPSTEFLYYGSAVIFMRDGKLLFTVSRSGDLPAVVRSLLIKEIVDDFQVYYPTLKRREPATTSTNMNPQESLSRNSSVDGSVAGLPVEPGVYYRSPNGWLKLSDASTAGIRMNGAGKSFLTWGLSEIRTAQVYGGGQAPTQIMEEAPVFFVRTIHSAVHNASYIRVRQKKNSRELPISTLSIRGAKVIADDRIVSRAIVDHLGDDVFRVRPSVALQSGEYVVRLAGSQNNESGYEFGIASSRNH
jgi:hypothetical protein